MSAAGRATVRVDSWLWAVRIFRTRSAATAACRAGHVRIGDERAKAAATVVVGDVVRVRMHGFDRVLEVTGLIAKRGSAEVARTNRRDLTPPRPSTPPVALRDRGAGRPTKRERREIERLRGY